MNLFIIGALSVVTLNDLIRGNYWDAAMGGALLALNIVLALRK